MSSVFLAMYHHPLHVPACHGLHRAAPLPSLGLVRVLLRMTSPQQPKKNRISLLGAALCFSIFFALLRRCCAAVAQQILDHPSQPPSCRLGEAVSPLSPPAGSDDGPSMDTQGCRDLLGGQVVGNRHAFMKTH